MQITIDVDMVLKIVSLLTALSTAVTAIVWCIKFIERQKKQDGEIVAIRQEQTLICMGVLACLKGLREQGCNGPVTEALNKLEKHLNLAAHEGHST